MKYMFLSIVITVIVFEFYYLIYKPIREMNEILENVMERMEEDGE